MSEAEPMTRSALLLEIGCEEIPARMIPRAADDLGALVARILDQAGLGHGGHRAWGGSRRLSVRVEEVEGRQADRDEQLLGPPAKVAFDAQGKPTKAAEGFAKKQGIASDQLQQVETDKGVYAGFRRTVTGATLGQVLARELPGAVEGMTFPKTMRWAEGKRRWVRPVHWLVALHGKQTLDLELLGVRSGSCSVGHRFRSSGPVEIGEPDRYEAALEAAGVIVDPARRRQILGELLSAAADKLGGSPVDDPGLLEEIVDLVEWPGVAAGTFDAVYLELPRELLVTTLRHHQKCFSVQDSAGKLLPAFLAVANTDSDPGGHIRRGNEWVVGGRLDDARFFWREDRKRTLASRADQLDKVVFHADVGSFGDKARRMERLARRVAGGLGLSAESTEHCAEAALLAKIDLVTGTVGEFPELQGNVGGLLLAAEGADREVGAAVYAHYRPEGPDDELPPTDAACVVALADKLDSVAGLIGAGQIPTGSRDPFGLRRASSGIFRIVIERGWALSLRGLAEAAGADERCLEFLLERLRNFLKEGGFTTNEIQAVLRPQIDDGEALGWPLPDIIDRLAAIRTVRDRPDFSPLADLTKRAYNILAKGEQIFRNALDQAGDETDFVENKAAALTLWQELPRRSERIDQAADSGDYAEVVELLAGLVDPVERFFSDVLVLDPDDPKATLHRRKLLIQLSGVLTRCFDIRELAGQAERRQDRG